MNRHAAASDGRFSSTRTAFSLVEVLVVITIMAILAALITSAVLMVRNNARTSQAQTMASGLHLAFENYLLERPFPKGTAEGNDASGYLGLADVDGGPSILQQMHDMGVFSFDHGKQIDNADRLIDPWDQPWNVVYGPGADANGHIPSAIAAADRGWLPINARATAEFRIYSYSYGSDNPDGAVTEQWIFNKRQ